MARNEMVRNNAGQWAGARDLTAQEAAFVYAVVVDGLEGKAAGEAARYKYPAQSASKLLRNPRVLAAIRDEQTKRLGGALASKAISYLETLLNTPHETIVPHEDADGVVTEVVEVNTKVAKLKLEAANSVLNRAGHIAPKAKEQERETPDDLSGFTTAQLEDYVKRNRAALDAIEDITNATTIEGEAELVEPGQPEAGAV